MRPSVDWEHSVPSEIDSSFVVWSIPIYLLLHSQFKMLDILIEETHWNFAAIIKTNDFVYKLEEQSSIPGPLPLYTVYYETRSALAGLYDVSPAQFVYVLKKVPELINSVLECGQNFQGRQTTIAWSLLSAVDTENSRPQILIDSGADVNYSPSHQLHSLNFLNQSCIKVLVHTIDWLIERGLMDFEYFTGEYRSSPVLRILKLLSYSCFVKKEESQSVGCILAKLRSLGYLNESRMPVLEMERECYRLCCAPSRPLLLSLPRKNERQSSESFCYCIYRSTVCVDLMGTFVQELDERRPLTLRELSRNAVRNHVGGIHFTARVRALHLPAQLTDFITIPA